MDSTYERISLPTGQDWFIQKMEMLGYETNGGGQCYGVATTSMLDFLLAPSKEATFTEQMPSFNKCFYEAYSLDGEALNRPNLHTFFGNISRRQNSQKKRFSTDSSNDSLYDEIACVLKFSGAYDLNDLVQYFEILQTVVTVRTSFLLSSCNHLICVHYDPKQGWSLTDANDLPTKNISDCRALAREVIDAFKAGREGPDHAIFYTKICTALEDQLRLEDDLEQLKKDEVLANDWCNLHDFSSEKIALTDAFKSNLLFIAARQGENIDFIESLIQGGSDVNQFVDGDTTALFIAAQNGHKDVVELLLRYGAFPDQADSKGATPLFIAAENGYTNVVELLLDEGANPNQPRLDGTTPLIIAIKEAHLYTVKALIQGGADVNLPLENGVTPLCMAVLCGNLPSVKILIQKGVDINQKISTGGSLLCFAILNGNKNMVEFLLNNGAHPNSCSSNGGISPLNLAIQAANSEMVEVLLEHGASPNKKINGMSPVKLAKQLGHTDLVDILSEASSSRRCSIC